MSAASTATYKSVTDENRKQQRRNECTRVLKWRGGAVGYLPQTFVGSLNKSTESFRKSFKCLHTKSLFLDTEGTSQSPLRKLARLWSTPWLEALFWRSQGPASHDGRCALIIAYADPILFYLCTYLERILFLQNPRQLRRVVDTNGVQRLHQVPPGEVVHRELGRISFGCNGRMLSGDLCAWYVCLCVCTKDCCFCIV